MTPTSTSMGAQGARGKQRREAKSGCCTVLDWELGMRMSTGNSGTCTTCVCTTVVQVCGGTLIANYFMYWYF